MTSPPNNSVSCPESEHIPRPLRIPRLLGPTTNIQIDPWTSNSGITIWVSLSGCIPYIWELNYIQQAHNILRNPDVCIYCPPDDSFSHGSQGTRPLVKMIVHDNAVNNVEIQRMFSSARWISGLRCVHHLCNLQLQAKNNASLQVQPFYFLKNLIGIQIDTGKAASNLKSKYDKGLVFAGL